jgi:hypothetical protein
LRDRRRGCRVLTRACFVFIIANLAGGLLLDYTWPELRFPEIGPLFRDLTALRRPPGVVVMGSSRFLGGVRPDVIDPLLREYTREGPRTFNASVTGGDALVHDRLLDRMLREGRRPGLLLVEVSPEHLTSHSPLLGQQVLRLMTWPDVPRYLPEVVKYSSAMQLLRSRLLSLYVHRYQIRKRLFGGQPSVAVRTCPDFTGIPPSSPRLVELPPEQIGDTSTPGMPPTEGLVRWLEDYRLSRVTTGALERLLRRCRDASVPVVLVGAPETVGHRHLCTPAVDTTYLGYVRFLAAKYGCRFVDFRDRIADAEFVDVMHMNQRGAALFSQALARDAVIPVWRETHR